MYQRTLLRFAALALTARAVAPRAPETLARAALLALAAVVLLLAPAAARANTITVNSTADALANDGQCTLREAIINSNNHAATWTDCAAGSGTNTIVLPAGTITLSIHNSPQSFTVENVSATGDLDILSSVTINGDPTGTAVNGGGLDRIFDINPPPDPNNPPAQTPSITVAINNLTITNGFQNDVGAVRINAGATVTMDGCTVSNSTSSANDSGGIYIQSGASLAMTNCTVSGNHAAFLGGGFKNEGTLTLTSCTVTNNSATTNRGQGIISVGLTTLANTIVSGNNGSDATHPDIEGTFTTLGYNIVSALNNPVTPATGDQFGVTPAQVALGPLQNNGGPTPTHELQAGSVAIDQGSSFGSTADQRGQQRPCDDPNIANAAGGDGSDVGAFEVQGNCVPPNQPPHAVDDSATVNEGSAANTIGVLANDSDPDGDALTITAVTQGSHGSVTNNGTNVSYTPAHNFFGADSFTYTISDGKGGTDTATVHVTVNDIHDAPVAAADSYGTNSNLPLNVSAPGVLSNDNDPDGDPLSAQLIAGPSHAASFALNADGSFSYTPAFNFAGTDSFTYRDVDGPESSNTVTVTITVHDTVPPVLATSVATGSLWPPNHDLVNVGLSASATDNSGGPVSIAVSVFSDEDDLTKASGEESPDAKDIAPATLRLRAERSGAGDGRVYLIVVVATDPSGNSTTNCLTVVVPKSQSSADISSVNQQAAAAAAYCAAHGSPPPGYFVVGDGPEVGPKQ
jgi:CSLREA domain-containing protein